MCDWDIHVIFLWLWDVFVWDWSYEMHVFVLVWLWDAFLRLWKMNSCVWEWEKMKTEKRKEIKAKGKNSNTGVGDGADGVQMWTFVLSISPGTNAPPSFVLKNLYRFNNQYKWGYGLVQMSVFSVLFARSDSRHPRLSFITTKHCFQERAKGYPYKFIFGWHHFPLLVIVSVGASDTITRPYK
jgi:hypothetical protein